MADAPFGALDADWRDTEAQQALALQQADAAKAKAAKRTWGDTARDVAGFPVRMAGSLAASSASPEADQAAMMPETFVNPLVKNAMDAVGGAVLSGATAPGRALAGEIPQWDAEGHTSPQMIRDAFDTASLAGGAGVAGTAGKAAGTLGRDFRVMGKKIGSGEPFPNQLIDHPVGVTEPYISPYRQPQNRGAVDARIDSELGWHANDDGLTPVGSGSVPKPWETSGGPSLMSDSAKPGAAIAAAEHAPPFYSGLEKAVVDHFPERAPADQILGRLGNLPGVKAEERKYTGVDDFLASKGDSPVTKTELLDHLENNKVQIGEVTKKNRSWDDLDGQMQHDLVDRWGVSPREAREMYESSQDAGEAAGGVRYSGYQLPGGTGYREKLLTLPTPNDRYIAATDAMRAKYGDMPLGKMPMTDSEKATIDKHIEAYGDNGGTYESSHWDEPNVLAHLRMNDRDVASATPAYVVRNAKSGNGSRAFTSEQEARDYVKTMPEGLQPNLRIVPEGDHTVPSLHLEEIQSDWHQAGRKQGYGPPSVETQYHLLNDRGGSEGVFQTQAAAEAERARLHGKQVIGEREPFDTSQWRVNPVEVKSSNGIPDAPFKKNWHELALKRALHEAAETGKDRISWTPGEAQAARYDLSKKIDHVAYNPTSGHLQAYDHGKRLVIDKPNIPKEHLPDFIGKEAAEKILNAPTAKAKDAYAPTSDYHMLENADLKVGGEGMKGFYDKIVPDYLNKIGKPHGVQVKSGTTRVGDEVTTGSSGLAPVHYMDIPPSLRQQLLTKGMPLFEDSSPGAAIAAAEHGEATERAVRSMGRRPGPAAETDVPGSAKGRGRGNKKGDGAEVIPLGALDARPGR